MQAELYPSLRRALAGRALRAERLGGIASPTASPSSGRARIALSILARHGVELLTVPEHRIEEAIGLLAEVEKTVAEGRGARPRWPPCWTGPSRFAGRRVGIVVSGGNIDPRLLASVLLRSLVRQGRLTRCGWRPTTCPAAWPRIAAIVGASGRQPGRGDPPAAAVGRARCGASTSTCSSRPSTTPTWRASAPS